MDKIKRLMNSSELKTSYLEELPKRNTLNFHYDDLSDTLMFLFVSPEQETIVHYLDRNVALLYRPDDNEIVGLQIEDFENEFVPTFSELKKVWCLSDFGFNDKNVWDLTIAAEKQKMIVALEIVKTKESLIGKPAKEFERVLQYA